MLDDFAESVDLIEAFDEPIFFIDEERRIVALNRTAKNVFGEIAIGSDLTRAFRNPSAIRFVDRKLQEESGDQFNDSIVFQTTRTVTTDYRLTVTRMPDRKREPSNFVVILKDVSHVMEAEQIRSDFVANVSHELRSPLTAISGFIETLAGSARDDKDAARRFLGIMEQEATRMNRIIDDLLSLSKVEANARVQPTEIVDLKYLVLRVIEMLEPQAKSQRKTISAVFADGSCSINGDDDQVIQVVQNLLENAIKYSASESTISVSVEHLESVSGLAGDAYCISVTDKGDGIAAEHLPRLTERFYRVDSGRSRQKGGTGLGLAIVKHIMNRHRGKFTIESKVGKGSVFSVIFPSSAER